MWSFDGFEKVGGWVGLVEFCEYFYGLVGVGEFKVVEWVYDWFFGLFLWWRFAKGDSPF